MVCRKIMFCNQESTVSNAWKVPAPYAITIAILRTGIFIHFNLRKLIVVIGSVKGNNIAQLGEDRVGRLQVFERVQRGIEADAATRTLDRRKAHAVTDNARSGRRVGIHIENHFGFALRTRDRNVPQLADREHGFSAHQGHLSF